MKKRMASIFLLVLAFGICIIVGFTDIPTIRNVTNDSANEGTEKIPSQLFLAEEIVISEAESDETLAQTQQNANMLTKDNSRAVVTEVLSSEDKTLKEEIAKYSDTAVDFRYNKDEKIGNQTYDISFFEVDSEKVSYKNGDDEFEYDINSGKLCYANIKSAVTEKSDSSINKEAAEKIAFAYAASNCDMNEHPLDSAKEIDNGYSFSYRRYIGKYRTPDVIVIEIGYGGEIIYVVDNTEIFADFDLTNVTIDEALVDSKIADAKSKLKEDEYFYDDSVLITLEEGELQVIYHIRKDCAIGIYYIPIE